jgi:membrane protease YdiL (CAAX protease family)
MERIPPRLDEARPINRRRWAIHLILITAYILWVMVSGLKRNKPDHPALTTSVSGLLLVCVLGLLLFGLFFGLAWLASRATRDDLLLRWRGKAMPVLLGLGYSLALRILLALIIFAIGIILVASQVITPAALQDFFIKHRPGVENSVDLVALRDNPAYFWLTLTLVSFVVAGLREELWRVSFLAGLKALWPRYFGSKFGQVWAVLIAAIIFGAAHLSMGLFAALYAGFLGMGLGLIMIFHRSIWPAVLAHGFIDATTMAILPQAIDQLQHLPKH